MVASEISERPCSEVKGILGAGPGEGAGPAHLQRAQQR